MFLLTSFLLIYFSAGSFHFNIIYSASIASSILLNVLPRYIQLNVIWCERSNLSRALFASFSFDILAFSLIVAHSKKRPGKQ